MSSSGLLSAQLGPEPWMLGSEVTLSLEAIALGPVARSDGICGVWEAQVLKKSFCESFACWRPAPQW